jgi:3',5'-cyclic AMP phosphodiesterase CpdA
MTKIAHLTDLHLVEYDHARRRGAARLRLSCLTLGRTPDAIARRRRAERALARACEAGADHLVLTGDLTEDGVDSQFEVLAEVLEKSGAPPGHVTLVPGNHDLYAGPDAWERAMAGPLRAYAATSAPGAVTALRDAVIVPVSTAVTLPVPRSGGRIDPSTLDHLATVASHDRLRGRTLVVAQHHPPVRHALAPVHWVDGLREHEELMALLLNHETMHILHGHTHRATDRPVRSGASARVFSAEAVVESDAPLRVYHAWHGRLLPDTKPVSYDFAFGRAMTG